MQGNQLQLRLLPLADDVHRALELRRRYGVDLLQFQETHVAALITCLSGFHVRCVCRSICSCRDRSVASL